MIQEASLTKWYDNKKVAFAIGVDEFPIGGSHNYGPKDEKWDTFYWYRNGNNFWSLYWKPILDKLPWIKYSMGWVPCHTSFLNAIKYSQPGGINPSQLAWHSKEGKKWIKEVMHPIFSYGSKHYDEYAAHGYYHEIGIDNYFPYWNKNSALFSKGNPYNNPKFILDLLKNLQKAFNYVWKHDCLVWNTYPFGRGRPDSPLLFNKFGIYGLGFWLDVSGCKFNELTGVKDTSEGVKSYKRDIGSFIEPEGVLINGIEHKKFRVGDVNYWKVDKYIADHNPFNFKDKNSRLVVVPYSVSLEGTTLNFKGRVKDIMEKSSSFKYPVLYYFMHAQMNWLDALGGGSVLQSYKSFIEELGFANFSKLRFKDPEFLLFNGALAVLLLIIAYLISPLVFLIILILGVAAIIAYLVSKSFFLSVLGKLKLFNAVGYNAKKHMNQMKWLHDNYSRDLWFATFSELTQYFDMRENMNVECGKDYVLLKNVGSFKWDSRKISMSLKVKTTLPVKGYSVKSKSTSHKSNENDISLSEDYSVLRNIPVSPLDKVISVKLYF